MNELEIKAIKETLEKLQSKKIDNDLEIGKSLIEKCKNYEKTRNCPISHQQEVINYISRIENEYKFAIKLCMIVNKIEPPKIKQLINCKNIDTCIQLLEKLKESKEYVDTYKKLCELLKK